MCVHVCVGVCMCASMYIVVNKALYYATWKMGYTLALLIQCIQQHNSATSSDEMFSFTKGKFTLTSTVKIIVCTDIQVIVCNFIFIGCSWRPSSNVCLYATGQSSNSYVSNLKVGSDSSYTAYFMFSPSERSDSWGKQRQQQVC